MTSQENEKLIRYRFEKAKETIAEAEVQLENRLWNLGVNRIYYACYYAVNALLASIEIYTKTHAGAKQMFSLHFIKTEIIDAAFSDFYTEIFTMRQSGDYEDYCDYEQGDVVPLIVPAKDFINAIEKILYKV